MVQIYCAYGAFSTIFYLMYGAPWCMPKNYLMNGASHGVAPWYSALVRMRRGMKQMHKYLNNARGTFYLFIYLF